MEAKFRLLIVQENLQKIRELLPLDWQRAETDSALRIVEFLLATQEKAK